MQCCIMGSIIAYTYCNLVSFTMASYQSSLHKPTTTRLSWPADSGAVRVDSGADLGGKKSSLKGSSVCFACAKFLLAGGMFSLVCIVHCAVLCISTHYIAQHARGEETGMCGACVAVVWQVCRLVLLEELSDQLWTGEDTNNLNKPSVVERFRCYTGKL